MNPGERDFRLLLQQAQKTNPDVYFVWFFPPELEIFAKQFKELDIKEPMTTIEIFSSSADPKLFEGCWYVDAADMPESFQERFFNKYGNKMTLIVGNSYDIINMFVWAYENTPSENNKPSVDKIVKTLSSLHNFNGMLGNLNMDENGIIQSQPTFKEIRNGKPVLLKKDL